MHTMGTKTIHFRCTMCGRTEDVQHTPRVGLYVEPGVPQGWSEQQFMVRVPSHGIFRMVSFPFCSADCRIELLGCTDNTMPSIVKQEIERLSAVPT